MTAQARSVGARAFAGSTAVARRLAAGCALLMLAACDLGESEAQRVEAVIASLERVDSVERMVRFTEDTDPDELLGRPGGYTDGAVFYDARLSCPQPGIDCGAVLEVWEDPGDAEARSEEIKALQLGMQMLGFEHHFVEGSLLLRVNGDLTEPQAEEYDAALSG